MSDGAGTSFLPGGWARILVQRAVEDPEGLWTEPDPWRERCRKAWDGYVEQRRDQEWWNAVPGETSCATLLAVRLGSPGDDTAVLRQVGDTVAFHVRGGRLLDWCPRMKAAEFGRTPPLITTSPRSVPLVADHCFPLIEADRVILATDALAKWLLERTHDGREALDECAEAVLSVTDSATFAVIVARERELGRLDDDDTTLMVAQVGRTPFQSNADEDNMPKAHNPPARIVDPLPVRQDMPLRHSGSIENGQVVSHSVLVILFLLNLAASATVSAGSLMLYHRLWARPAGTDLTTPPAATTIAPAKESAVKPDSGPHAPTVTQSAQMPSAPAVVVPAESPGLATAPAMSPAVSTTAAGGLPRATTSTSASPPAPAKKISTTPRAPPKDPAVVAAQQATACPEDGSSWIHCPHAAFCKRPDDVTIKVIKAMNLRSGAGEDYQQCGAAVIGSYVVHEEKDGWVRITMEGGNSSGGGP